MLQNVFVHELYKKIRLDSSLSQLCVQLNYFNNWNMSRFGRRRKKKTDSEKLSDTGRARVWASRDRAGPGPEFGILI